MVSADGQRFLMNVIPRRHSYTANGAVELEGRAVSVPLIAQECDTGCAGSFRAKTRTCPRLNQALQRARRSCAHRAILRGPTPPAGSLQAVPATPVPPAME